MKYIQPIYSVNKEITSKHLYDYGFRRISNSEMSYRFTVYKYQNKKPLMFCEFIYNDEEKQIHIIVKDINGVNYNYNAEEYGKSDVVKQINTKINTVINQMNMKGIIE